MRSTCSIVLIYWTSFKIFEKFLTVIIFVPLYRFRNTRHRYFVHANLALSLGLAETLFVIGVTKTANQVFMSMQL